MEVVEKVNNKRNYGIDLLRIISMMFVVLLHCLGHGGIIHNADINSIQYKVSWFMEIIAYCAVDIFALISGYVAYSDEKKKTCYANYGMLWLEVVFYGILITFIFDIFNIVYISIKDYFIVLLPVTNKLYWYFTAYTGLFIVMPIINNGIRNTNNKDLKILFWLILLVFSMFDNLIDGFRFNNGYSFIWLLLLYVLGAIIKKCQIGKNLSNFKIVLGIILLVLITYLYKIYGFELSILLFDIHINNDWFVSYISPTILVIAILYILLFSRIKFNNSYIKVIKYVAPSSFAIYVLNNHHLIWDYIIEDMFINIANGSIVKIILYPLIFTILFSFIVIFMDKLRQLLFNRMRIKFKIERLISYVIKEE